MDSITFKQLIETFENSSEEIITLKLPIVLQFALKCAVGSDVSFQEPWTLIKKKKITIQISENKQHELYKLRNHLMVYPDEDVLVILVEGPSEEATEHDFSFILNKVAKNALLTIILRHQQEENVAQKRIDNSDDAPFCFSRNLVLESKPSRDNQEDISTKVQPKQIKMLGMHSVSVKLSERETTRFSDSANENVYHEFAPSASSSLHVIKSFHEKSVQAVEKMEHNCTQTVRPLRRNTWSQYVPQILDNKTVEEIGNSLEFGNALEKIYTNIKPDLERNVFDLFKDDFEVNSETFKEGNYSYAEGNVQIVDFISGHPVNQGMKIRNLGFAPFDESILFTSSVENLSIESQINKYSQIQLRVKCILIWNLKSPDKPKLILETRSNVSKILFHAKGKNVIVASGMNGEIYVWNLGKYWADISAKPERIDTVQDHVESIEEMAILQPTYVSNNANSSPIVSMFWSEIINTPRETEGPDIFRNKTNSPFLITIRRDGRLQGWLFDLRNLQMTKSVDQSNPDVLPSFNWNPILKSILSVAKERKVFVTSACIIKEIPGAAKDTDSASSEKLYIGLENGELLSTNMIQNKDESDKNLYYVKTIHTGIELEGPVRDIQLCPNTRTIAVIGGGTLVLLDTCNDVQLMSSSVSSNSITNLCFSYCGSRVYVGRSNGILEMWQTLKSEFKPVMTRKIFQTEISALAMNPHSIKDVDCLVAGDDESNIAILLINC